MLFQRAIPPGPPVAPEDSYAGLDLATRAPAGRPYVVCNFVSTADGRATAQGRTALLGGEADRAAFHLLRTQVDAVLAGTGTLRVERYGKLAKNDSLSAIRTAEGRPPQPLGVVISRSGQVPFDIPLFADAGSRVALYAPARTAVPDCAAQIFHHDIPTGEDAIPRILRSLQDDHAVDSLLCEGGPALFSSLVAADVVDELFLTLAPALVGGDEIGITTGSVPGMRPLTLIWAMEHDGNLFLRYRRAAGE